MPFTSSEELRSKALEEELLPIPKYAEIPITEQMRNLFAILSDDIVEYDYVEAIVKDRFEQVRFETIEDAYSVLYPQVVMLSAIYEVHLLDKTINHLSGDLIDEARTSMYGDENYLVAFKSAVMEHFTW